VPWSDEQKAAFLESQFDLQDAAYRTSFPGASFDVVLCDGELIGRLYVAHGANEVRLIEITLVEAQRNQGIGSRLIRDLMEIAATQHKRLVLQVDLANEGAQRLYLRLGFSAASRSGLYEEMRWP
jgi:ribosomal protein S18 acetylase RimI-like enzyme